MIPDLFKARMQSMLSSEYDSFMASYDLPQYHALRINPLKGSPDTILKEFASELTPIPWCSHGYYYSQNIRPGRHPYHEAGAYYIQEPSAMVPAEYLDVHAGDMVLDLCAAPGGKSTQIACHMNGKGLLVSNEIVPQRAKILSENIERLGIANAVVTNESPERLADFFPSFFDKIMVDAPCSGEGMFRKNSDACLEWSPDNVKRCATRQSSILDHAATMLKPGGRMVYSTCTFAPEENEGSIVNFLLRHRDFKLVHVQKMEGMSEGKRDYAMNCIDTTLCSEYSKDELENILNSLSHTIRLWPHLIKGEGHFVAVLEKSGVKEAHTCTYQTIKAVKDKSLKDYLDFCDSFFINRPSGAHILFGNQLYVVPEHCPNLDKLKVLRPGLHLGTFLKNRFEPSHSLALYLKPEDVKNIINLTLDRTHNFTPDNTRVTAIDELVYRYLNGESIECDGNKGWNLICVNGYSIGFGKLSEGVLKNHYPKGLRKNLR